MSTFEERLDWGVGQYDLKKEVRTFITKQCKRENLVDLSAITKPQLERYIEQAVVAAYLDITNEAEQVVLDRGEMKLELVERAMIDVTKFLRLTALKLK
ncbi:MULTISPECIES: hypothetical protein [unclassified Vibrio]|uniref:hypothetical protein n=1 Tax=unclassified Vibrio TaxID=2614977 RepID=UPI00159D68EA|nr:MULTISPECIES: hypothetical protein [unclassified Vibrio]NVN84006.1 hypothetical protein [Vibrio sp. Scap16]QLE93859.1 hypothetical protein FLM53_12970 [Vibrio sp. Scap24]